MEAAPRENLSVLENLEKEVFMDDSLSHFLESASGRQRRIVCPFGQGDPSGHMSSTRFERK
jgi:hypothetical protein